MRTIGVVSVARSDYGIYLPVMRRIQSDPELRLHLIVSGMHLSPEFGRTVDLIEQDGFEIGDRIEMLLSSDSPEGIAKSVGIGIISFAQLYARFRPDILLVLGDRFEMFAAALAALPFKIPLAHIHGGEITEGAIDDALRHSMTKLSHLHFVSTQEYGRRVIQLGEEAWRVHVVGAPGLDNIRNIQLMSLADLEAKFGICLNQSPLLVTFHPVSLEYEQTERQMVELLAALETFEMPVVFTRPNADTNNGVITRKLEDYVQKHDSAWLIDNLGTQAFFSLLSLSKAMVGNSSSGIIEAASFELPVVNIGSRQRGRIRGANVIDVGYSRDDIFNGLRRALDPHFRSSLRGLRNPYGSGSASEEIVHVLKTVALDEKLIVKHFNDQAVVPAFGDI